MNQKMKNAFIVLKTIALASSVLLLASCSRTNTTSDLEQYVAQAKSRPGAEVAPLPTFEPYEAFTYSAASFRGPFDVPVVVLPSDDNSPARNVEPDFDRTKDPLEEHAIADLAMVGMMERNRTIVALIEDEIGAVHRIKLGNYLGRNHGKVVAITPTQLDLVEIVPSGDGGWIERPQSLALLR
jgi:type IV pilus assembly protein PilP